MKNIRHSTGEKDTKLERVHVVVNTWNAATAWVRRQ